MPRGPRISSLLVGALALAAAAAAHAASMGARGGGRCSDRTDRLIVELADPNLSQPSPELLARWSDRAGIELAWHRSASGGLLVLRTDGEREPGEMAAAAGALAADPAVLRAEPDLRVWPVMTPSDPRYAEQW
ncbi:MAG: hypothetical protein IH608_02185, partial [Proteobacteria bacterium]|nr:hypothetical protein [Pseudomonadota bacterium]